MILSIIKEQFLIPKSETLYANETVELEVCLVLLAGLQAPYPRLSCTIFQIETVANPQPAA